MTKEEFDSDPRYNGQPIESCDECGRQILPWGRSAPMEMEVMKCEHKQGGSLWPGETREGFGYGPKGMVEESARLREQFYGPPEPEEEA